MSKSTPSKPVGITDEELNTYLAGRKAPKARITPEAIAAWRAGNRFALHRALGLRPWDLNPLDAGERPRITPEALVGRVMGGIFPGVALSHASWNASVELRQALVRASRRDAN